jgi:hypothetical protein
MFAEITEFFTHTIFVVGVLGIIAGFVLSFIPILNRYKFPIQVISILIFAWGVYLEGGLAQEKKLKQKIAELEVKLKDAEIRASKVNTKIVKEILTKREVIREKGEDIIKYIDREVVHYDKTCPIPESVIKAHNAAALSKSVEELTVATPTTPVDTKLHNDAAKSKLIFPKK